MQEHQEGRIVKIINPFEFMIKDPNIKDNAYIKIQVKPGKNQHFQHLLPIIFSQNITYSLQKKKSNKIRQQSRKGVVYLNRDEITSLYRQKNEKQYMGSEINTLKTVECFVSKVECLKVELISLKDMKYITFYFSELKLIRVGNIHPKEMWQRSQQYFKSQIDGQFVTLTVSGSQNYKEQVNIFGDIVRVRDSVNIRKKTIEDGYAQLSKDSQKYLSKEQIEQYNRLRDKAKKQSAGLWETSKNITKSNIQAQQFRYNEWQKWLQQGRVLSKLRNQEEQFKIILQQMNKLSRSQGKIQQNKVKIILDVIIMLFENQFSKKYLKFLEDIVKILSIMLSNMQIPFSQHLDNLDSLKTLNKILCYLIFHHQELEKLIQQSKGERIMKNNALDLQKCIKFIFKLCFLGNQTFNDKIFGKQKQSKYQSFNFENAYLQGGFSSMSQSSDYQDGDKLSKEQKKEKKLISAQQKIRINSTQLLSTFFKHYPNLVQNYWQMCVTSNILTKDFLTHVKKLRITTSEVKMSLDQKRQVVNLMRSNFGQHSLILLSIFQKNNKVKANSVICLLHMISNFQGKKLIATTQSSYIQKLLKQTKSSFVPKSFIIFSALRNALYFLLFALYYEKNLQIIISIFKTLCQICNNSSLIDKMSFQEGIGLLLRNYVVPVLQFQWGISQLEELKILCINFLGVLVNNNRKWQQIQQHYLKSESRNINKQLIEVMKQRLNKISKQSQDKLIAEILNYFTKLTKNYFSVIFYKIENKVSIWQQMKENFINKANSSYSIFVQEIFKGYLDQNQSLKKNRTSNSIKMQDLYQFLKQYIKVYSTELTPTNYIHLLGTLTYIDYQQWSKPQFEYVKKFTMHCFQSFVQTKSNYPQFQSINGILNNSLVRVTLIKLVGYLSFCPQFQTEDITKKAVNALLELSKQYKSFNSLVKISWGLSNWAKVPNFSIALNEKQLKGCLDYMMTYSQSDKEKIASNCTRGIGFFVSNVNKKFNLKECRKQIIKNLSHNISKVRTNSTKTLLNLVEDFTQNQIKEVLPILQQNILKNNYHLQMETLQLLKKMGYPIERKRLLGLFVSILKNLMNYTTIEYEFSQIKTIRQLRLTLLTEIFEIKDQIVKSFDLSKDILVGICQFLLKDCSQKQKNNEQNLKTVGKQFQKSQQAQKLIFNKKTMQRYNEQKIIQSQVMNKGLRYKGSVEQLRLLSSIKEFFLQYEEKLNEEWKRIQTLRIQGDTIYIDFSALRTSQLQEDVLYIAKE